MMISNQANSKLEAARKFQKNLLDCLPIRQDAILQLVEALASAEKPTSVVELSQEVAFRRTFSNVHKAIDALSAGCLRLDTPSNREEIAHLTEGHTVVDLSLFLEQSRQWTNLFAERVPHETSRPFKLFAIDATSDARPYAQTLKDRTYVHAAGQFGAPITVGVQASVLVAIPEKQGHEAKWTLPLSVERIPSNETPCQTAEKQLKELQSLASVSNSLCVIAADSGYTHLKPQGPNQVIVARSRTDRTGRRPYGPASQDVFSRRGRPRKYQDPVIHFSEIVPVGDQGGPDEEHEYETVYGKKEVIVFASRWKDIYVHGQEDLVDVVKIELFLKDDLSQMLFEKPLILLVSGKRRSELTCWHIYESYLCRFDIEHLFRFLKRQLLFCSYQTPELHRQVNWWWICFMAYWLLYLVRESAPESNRPWAQKRVPQRTASPGEVKRVFGSKIFPDLGSPSRQPISRGKSKGRVKGVLLKPRKRYKPIKKTVEQRQVA